MKRFKLLAALILAFHLSISAQEACFTKIAEGQITCIEENFQFIWAGTYDQGLIKYDKFAQTVEYLDTSNSLIPSNNIQDLANLGPRMFMSTDSAIYSLHSTTPWLLTDSVNGALGIDSSGTLMSAAAHDFYIYDYSEILGPTVNFDQVVQHSVDLLTLSTELFSCLSVCDRSTDILTTTSNETWISHYGFYEFDILQFDGTNWTVHDIQSSNGVLPIESFGDYNRLAEYQNSILCTAVGKMYEYKDEQWTQYPPITNGNDTLGQTYFDIEADQVAGLWLGTFADDFSQTNGRLCYYDGANWEFFALPTDSAISILRIFASSIHDSLLYVGTTDGLYRLNKSCLPLSIEAIQDQAFNIYPIPAKNELFIDIDGSCEVEVMDLSGRSVFSTSVNGHGSGTSINTSTLVPGQYMLRLQQEDGSRSRLFQIER